MTTTLYERIGGESRVREVLERLYQRLVGDPMVGFLFAGKDVEHIVVEQLAFTCKFLGGPHRYDGRPLPEAHAALPLLPGHFDRRHHVLAEVLAELAVPDEVVRVWLRIDESLRPSVLASGIEARNRARQS